MPNKHHQRRLFLITCPKCSRAGFTLVEILVVMVIIGILTTVGLGNYVSSQQKSRDARRKSDLGQIKNSLELYYNDRGRYPTSSTGKIVGCNSGGVEVACTWGDPWTDVNGTIYMVTLPADPGGANYYYVSSGTNYKLYALLENDQDPTISTYTGTNCGGGIECNYGTSSSNIAP